MVIFLAALRQVPVSLYEAASIDGAGVLQQFRCITLPMLTPVIFFNLVLHDDPRVPGVHAGLHVIARHAAARSTARCSTRSICISARSSNLDMGYAAAMAWVLLVAIAPFTAALFWSARFWVFYGDDDDVEPGARRRSAPVPARRRSRAFGLQRAMICLAARHALSGDLDGAGLAAAGARDLRRSRIPPDHWTLENYMQGWSLSGNVTFAMFFLNSFLICALAIVGNLMSCSMAGYAFGRLSFRLKWFWFAIMLGTIMLPIHAQLIPQYIFFQAYRLGEHDPAAGRAEIPRHGRVLHLPDGAVHARAAGRTRTGGGDRRRLVSGSVSRRSSCRSAAGHRDHGGLHLHPHLQRFPEPAHLSVRAARA